MKRQIKLIRHLTIVALFFSVPLIAACSKESEGDGEPGKIEISPVPTEPASPPPSPAPKTGVPLDPMETWCESMMVKPNQEWTKDEALKFSEQCLYND